MRLHVVHHTVSSYTPAVRAARHLACLRPADREGQRVLRHALRIEPGPAHRSESRDRFGNLRTFFELEQPHGELRVVADSVVETSAPAAPPLGLPWEAARERLGDRGDGPYDPAAEFRFASPYVPLHPDLAAYARPSFTPGRPLLEAARDLAARIHREFAYVREATDVGTPALQALQLRQGVCQDFAHVLLGGLRSLGLAARYVSGYLLTEPPPGQPRLLGADASHAWVAVYLPGRDGPGCWAGLDPTNDRAPGEDYVQLASGRDYADVAPLRGVLEGGAQHGLQVAVTVAPLQAD